MRYGLIPGPLIFTQCGMVALALAVAAFRPPEAGRMLLVPIWSNDGGLTVRTAMSSGALLIGTGPWRGSIVVQGNYHDLAASAWRQKILIIAAPLAGCGAAEIAKAAI